MDNLETLLSTLRVSAVRSAGGGARLTLLMAFRAQLAALDLSGWPWVLRQSVWRRHQT